MQTYAHVVLTAAAAEAAKVRGATTPHATFLLGAALPDLPLGALSAGFLAWGRLTGRSDEMTLCGDRYNNLYFNHPVWITGHNLFHAPLLLMAYAAAGRTAWRRGATWAGPWLWLIAGCGLHTAVDFVTHVDDGPLPLFPIGRSRRVRGLVSYWDPEFGGRWFSRLEKLGSILLAVWVFLSWMRRHHNR